MWKKSHLLSIPLAYIAIALISVFSRKMSDKGKTWFFRILLIILFVGEGVKQIVGFSDGSYPLNSIPLHFSSTFYVSFSFFAFGKGFIKQMGACVGFISGFFTFAALTVNPNAVVGDSALMFSSYGRFHSYFFHIIVILFWSMMVFQNAFTPKEGDFLKFCIFLGGWAVLAVPGAYLLQINYSGILHSFFPPFESLRLAAGDFVYQVVYAACALSAAALILFTYNRIREVKRAHGFRWV